MGQSEKGLKKSFIQNREALEALYRTEMDSLEGSQEEEDTA